MPGLRWIAAVFAFASVAVASGGRADAQSIPTSGLIKSPFSGLCAEIAGGSTSAGAKATQQTCSTAAQQQWTFQADAAGGHRLINKASSLCLGVVGSSVTQGAAAEQQACTGAAGQRWTIAANGAAVELRNANSGQCLEIGGASTSPGATLSQWGCVGVSQQTWTLVSSVPSGGLVVNRRSGMCAQMPAGGKASGLGVTQWTCDQRAFMNWDFRPAAGGAFKIVNRNSGLCLDVKASSKADGAIAIQNACGTQTSQLWTMRAKEDSVELVAAHSGKCLDVEGSSIDGNGRILQWTCNSGANQQWSLLGGPARSAWTGKINLPIVPVAASVLRNGKILTWSAYDRFAFGGDRGKTFTALYDPATNTASERLVSNTGHDMFCPGTTTLADGRILVTGGSSAGKASIYNPETNIWSATSALNVPRGYQGDTLLSNGDVFTVGGSWSGQQGGKIGEVWNRSTGTWRKLTGVTGESMAGVDPEGIYRGDNHMWLYGVANGYVFQAGPSPMMHWVDTAGAGKVADAGKRGDDAYAMNGNVVMYDAGRLLKMGGAPGYGNRVAVSTAYTIDFSRGPGQPVAVKKQKPMAFPRAFANAVVLPNGDVVTLGGQSYPVGFSDERSIMIPEIWSPATNEFQRLAEMTIPRTYHSVAGLMLDGRVFVGGGGLCGSCKTNHPDIQILTPPYLLNADGSLAARPTIASAPTTATLNETITVSASGATAFALVRMSSTTHSVNNDQRRLPLPIVSANGSSVQLKLPSDRGTLMLGDWMLFAMNGAGAPSVAKVIRVQ